MELFILLIALGVCLIAGLTALALVITSGKD